MLDRGKVVEKGINIGTYKEIQKEIQNRHGCSVKTCWIAHIKELNGLNPRKASNRISMSKRTNPCPANIRPIIEDSMRRFGMID